jgi:hypothetical protein
MPHDCRRFQKDHGAREDRARSDRELRLLAARDVSTLAAEAHLEAARALEDLAPK